MGVVQIVVSILAITSSAVVVGLLLLPQPGFIVTPKPVDTPSQPTARERELLRQINEISGGLSDDFWSRYSALVAKRRKDTLTPDGPEHQELMRLTNELECRHAERLMRLVELAKLRNMSLAEVESGQDKRCTLDQDKRWGRRRSDERSEYRRRRSPGRPVRRRHRPRCEVTNAASEKLLRTRGLSVSDLGRAHYAIRSYSENSESDIS